MNIRAEIFGGRQERRILKEKQPKQGETKGLADVAISREESRRTNNRDHDRYRLTGAVFKLSYHGRDHDVEVVNLSGGGAMVAADILPGIGDRLHLHLGEGGAIECAVRWLKGGRLGLEFAHETQLQCSRDEQAALLREVISRDFPDEKFDKGQRTESTTAEPTEDNRAAVRHPLIWWGDLHYGSHSWHVRLRNISATGALIECPGQLRLDSEVLLDMGKAGTLTATVSWAVGDHIGIKFHQPFDMQRLCDAKPKVTPPMWLRPAYLEGEVDPESAWDEAWSRMSVDDLRHQLEGFLKR